MFLNFLAKLFFAVSREKVVQKRRKFSATAAIMHKILGKDTDEIRTYYCKYQESKKRKKSGNYVDYEEID
jgi:hypothetical protein